MIKYLLLLALIGFLWWLWRKSRRSADSSERPAPAAERMVSCAYCGLNQPVSESLLAQGRYYCCPAHREEAGAAPTED